VIFRWKYKMTRLLLANYQQNDNLGSAGDLVAGDFGAQ
jgi:hypothetical protein